MSLPPKGPGCSIACSYDPLGVGAIGKGCQVYHQGMSSIFPADPTVAVDVQVREEPDEEEEEDDEDEEDDGGDDGNSDGYSE